MNFSSFLQRVTGNYTMDNCQIITEYKIQMVFKCVGLLTAASPLLQQPSKMLIMERDHHRATANAI